MPSAAVANGKSQDLHLGPHPVPSGFVLLSQISTEHPALLPDHLPILCSSQEWLYPLREGVTCGRFEAHTV